MMQQAVGKSLRYCAGVAVYFLFLVCSLLFSCSAVAGQSSQGFWRLPDPVCFLAASNKTVFAVEEGRCAAQMAVKKISRNRALTAAGYAGYDFEKTLSAGVSFHGYVYYRILADTGRGILLYLIANAGGSGERTSLLLVNRRGNGLTVRVIQTGDRCDGGIFDPVLRRRNQGKAFLEYHVRMTSAQAARLAGVKNAVLPDGREDCMTCCRAEAVFRRDFSHFEKAVLVRMKLKR